MLANKVCPVILRRSGFEVDVLAFEHPLAGYQLVKGTIETNESIEMAALRELAEESGILSARVLRSLGIWSSNHEGQIWEFVECEPCKPLAESWLHHAPDDGGHTFRFFWHPLFETTSSSQWHYVFRGALSFIQNAV